MQNSPMKTEKTPSLSKEDIAAQIISIEKQVIQLQLRLRDLHLLLMEDYRNPNVAERYFEK